MSMMHSSKFVKLMTPWSNQWIRPLGLANRTHCSNVLIFRIKKFFIFYLCSICQIEGIMERLYSSFFFSECLEDGHCQCSAGQISECRTFHIFGHTSNHCACHGNCKSCVLWISRTSINKNEKFQSICFETPPLLVQFSIHN